MRFLLLCAENEEVRHRVKKSKGSEDSDDEAKKGDKGKTSRKAPATTKERMLQLRQENQRLRKSVPIDFGERVEEEGAKISIANLLGDLKKKQPQKEEEVVEEDDEEAIEELALLDKVGDIFDTVAAPAEMEEEEEQEAEEEEQEQEEEEQDSEVDAGTAGTNEEEAAALGDSEAAAADAAAAAPTFDPHWLGGELNLRIDDAVRIQGLKGAPQHNGKEARVDSYDANVEGGARYTVRLLIHAAGEDSRLQVRPANLEVLAAAEPAAAETPAAAALSVTDEMKARMEKNRQVALAKREARRLSSSQSASKPADGMAGFFNSGETPAAASLSYDVPMPSPASGGPNAAADPIATELSFEEELAKAVEAAESGPISSGLSFDEEMAKAAEAAESQMATSPAPATQEEQASLPVDDVDEPEAPKDDSVEIDGKPASEETTADAAAEGAEAPAEAEAEEEEEEEEEEEMVDFIAVDEWGGERLGYYFGSGKEGPGYMLDSKVPGDTIPAFQMGVATETLTKWVLSGGDEPSEEKVKVLEPFGWMQVDAEGGFETELTKEQFREIGAAMKAIRASKVEEEEEATQVEDDDDEAEGEEGAEDEAAEAAALEKKKEEEEMEQAELDLDLSLENDKTGQKWSPFKPKPTSRRALRTQMQEQLFIKRAKKKKEMKDAGLIPLDGSMMGPDLEPDQDDEYAPEDEEQREEDNEAAMDAMLNDAEDAVDDVMPVDPEADEKDYQTIDDDTQMDEDDDEPEVELTEEEKLAKEEADAVAAALAEEETKKRLAREAADLKRRAIERRKEQILELRKMALDDRAARKANRALNRGGLMEAEADESGSDFSDDDDEESAERQAIEELRGIDYLAAADSEDENTDTHREMLAKQLGDDMEGFLKQRGDVFDDNGKIIRHGKKMRQMLKAQKVVEEDDMAKKLANASSDEESSSSDDSDDDKSANQFDAAGGSPAQAAAGGAEGDAAAAAGGEGAPARVFAFAAGGVGEAATEPALPTPRDGEAPVLTEKQRRKARKKLQKRMRRAVRHPSSTSHLAPVCVSRTESHRLLRALCRSWRRAVPRRESALSTSRRWKTRSRTCSRQPPPARRRRWCPETPRLSRRGARRSVAATPSRATARWTRPRRWALPAAARPRSAPSKPGLPRASSLRKISQPAAAVIRSVTAARWRLVRAARI